jgi:hypothetical protein
MEMKIKEHIMDDIFCDRPFDENDWDSFMKNSALEFPDNFQVCQEFELNPLNKPKKIFISTD